MADQETRSRRRRTAKPQRFQVFGIKLNRREFIFFTCCIGVIVVVAIGVLLSGNGKPKEPEPDKKPPVSDGTEATPPEPFQLSRSSLSLEPGGQAALSFSGEKGEVTWTTSDAKVATVADGLVTGVAGGSATVTAVSGDESAVCTVTVSGDPYVDVSELYLNHTDFTFQPNDTGIQLQVKRRDTKAVYGGAVAWSSSDPAVATVNESGLVEWAGKKGMATITATINGQTLECIARKR